MENSVTLAVVDCNTPSKEAATLLAKLRNVTTLDRVRGCQVRKCREEIGLRVRDLPEGRKATAHGVLTCNSVWACPVDSRRIRARRMQQLTLALRGGLEAHADRHWRMLSITLRHHAGQALKDLRAGLMRAWRRTRMSRKVRVIFDRHVRATARTVEITHGVNGWHPHIHLAMLTDDWSDDERALLAEAWEASVMRELGEACRPDDAHGLKWSARKLHRGDGGSKLEAYLTDIGLEVSQASTKTARRTSSRTCWQVASDAANGNDASRKLWNEYEQATRGARAIELDERAADFAVRQAVAEVCDEGSDSTSRAPSVYVTLRPEVLRVVRDYERIDPVATSLWIAAAERAGPLEEASSRVQECFDMMLRRLKRTWSDYREDDRMRCIAAGAWVVGA